MIDFSTLPDISDMDILYDAMLSSMKGSQWKVETQKFYNNWGENLVQLHYELKNKTYRTSKGTEFILNERGKTRYIHGSRIRDRIVRHAFCDNILGPCLQPYLIYNNGASQKGKGISFSRKMLEKDLHNYYLHHGTNEGFIVIIDLSKFYDNIKHDKVKQYTYPKIPEKYHWLLDEILRSMEIDLSFVSDDEFDNLYNGIFDSIAYHATLKEELCTRRKMMKKSCNIGDQVSQNIGIFFPHVLDNHAKIVMGIKYYGRYMDDMYAIIQSKEEVMQYIVGMMNAAKSIDLFINEKKTKIFHLRDQFKYLQIYYRLSDTGKVIKRINPKQVTRERRKLKAYGRLYQSERLDYDTIEQAYKSWMGSFAKLMSKKQRENMVNLYISLFNKNPRWK